ALDERADSRSPGAFLPDWVPTPANRRYRRSMEQFRETVDGLIERRRRAPGEYDDLLAILLDAEDESGRTMSDEEVRDQMITFLFAGHETTSLALTYAFLLLAQHDQVREKLDAEHERVLGGAAPTLADLDDLEYTETVIDEAMRLYPPAYVMFREALEDVEIGGYRVPEGTVVTLPQFRLHVDERFYDDPERFRPERWTDEFEEQLPEYAYFPFGGGPRHCIGMRFAMLELKTVLPTIAQRVDFELLSDPDPDLGAGITLQPDEDVRMRVSKR
ncbi:cytochrome P450, partial [Natronoarchaeum mannanilyticum]